MMLRNRNLNTAGNAANGLGPKQDAKRGAKKALSDNSQVIGEPRPKRQAFSDISQAVANFVIDSTKKAEKRDSALNRRSTRRSSEQLATITEQENLEASVVEIPVEDPCPSYDFDAESAKDPLAVHEYAFDIFKYYRTREQQFKVFDYMKQQHQLTADKRSALMDWMVEIQENFELNHETLYLAVKLVDLYLCCERVKLSELQLVACAAIFIASKFDERSPPLIDDFIYIAEDSFSREQLIVMERKLLNTVGFDLGCPLSYRFLRRYARVCKEDMPTLTLARYILELSLMFYEFCGVSESRMAAACFLLASKMNNKDNWGPVLQKYTGYRLEEVEPLMWELNHMLHLRPTNYSKLCTVYSKYSHEVFFRSASVPLLPNKFPKTRPLQAPEGQGFEE